MAVENINKEKRKATNQKKASVKELQIHPKRNLTGKQEKVKLRVGKIYRLGALVDRRYDLEQKIRANT